MQPLDDFLAKTHQHLGSLTQQAAMVRRSTPNHRPCADNAACRWCANLRDIHELIDDSLEQLELAGLDPDPDPLDCIACGRRRYTDGIATLCASCDTLTRNGRTWTALPDREHA